MGTWTKEITQELLRKKIIFVKSVVDYQVAKKVVMNIRNILSINVDFVVSKLFGFAWAIFIFVILAIIDKLEKEFIIKSQKDGLNVQGLKVVLWLENIHHLVKHMLLGV